MAEGVRPIGSSLTLSGSGPHEDDRFGQMKLNDGHFAARDEYVLSLVIQAVIPTVVL